MFETKGKPRKGLHYSIREKRGKPANHSKGNRAVEKRGANRSKVTRAFEKQGQTARKGLERLRIREQSARKGLEHLRNGKHLTGIEHSRNREQTAQEEGCKKVSVSGVMGGAPLSGDEVLRFMNGQTFPESA